MKQIIVASNNPVKIDAVRLGFQSVFPDQPFAVSGLSVPSGVSVQPMTDVETLAGARKRAENARAAAPEADFWAGVEGGVESAADGMQAFAWVVVLGPRQIGEARTGMFFLPPEIARLVREGVELGTADDIVFGRVNSKQQDGAVGILTGGLIDRKSYYEQAVVLALIPFLNADLYQELKVEG